jgi:hypothetical protein
LGKARRGHPSLEGSESGAALSWVLNNDVAGEAASVGKALALGASGQEQTAQRHAQVISFGDLEQGEHTFSMLAGSDYFFA